MNKPNITMPEAVNGFIPTLNKNGYMACELDRYTRAFVDFARLSEKPVVDIGAAYGVASIPAVEEGAEVIAVDLDERHLKILEGRIPRHANGKLTTICASFPDDLNLEKDSVGAFLIARVVHFFSPEKLERSMVQLYNWLTPKGKVFLTAETPYLSNWESFIPEYERRCGAGYLWPGYVDNVIRYAPDRGKNLPPTMMFLDPDVLTRVFTESGFEIEECGYLARPEFPPDLRRDGRESVGVIARK